MRSAKDYIFLGLKGIAMGAADVVPGVSGGTIAFISGIYEELINTISKINLNSLKLLFRGRVSEFWKEINGNFLVVLLSGIVISILSLAKLITYLLKEHPILIWSFFFGLVVASIFLVGRDIKTKKLSGIFAFIVGAVLAWWVTSLPPIHNPEALWYILISGMIAICAMILPGISGSFILVLMGSYSTILAALQARSLDIIGVFIIGAIIGILSFSHLLKWMFAKYHNFTLALLCGFLLGSLNKIWPWKETLETYVKHAGTPEEEVLPLLERNVGPATYESLSGEPALVLQAIAVGFAGFAIIFILERLAAKKAKK